MLSVAKCIVEDDSVEVPSSGEFVVDRHDWEEEEHGHYVSPE